MRVLTLATLHTEEACEGQRDKFRQRWGNQVEVTEEEMAKHARIFDWTWATDQLCTREARDAAYDQIDAERLKLEESLVAARAKANDSGSDEDYRKAAAELRDLSRKVDDQIYEIRARAFARAYIASEPKKEKEDGRVESDATAEPPTHRDEAVEPAGNTAIENTDGDDHVMASLDEGAAVESAVTDRGSDAPHESSSPDSHEG